MSGTKPNTSLLDVNYSLDGNTLVMGTTAVGAGAAAHSALAQHNYHNVFVQSIVTQQQLQAGIQKAFDKFALLTRWVGVYVTVTNCKTVFISNKCTIHTKQQCEQ